MSSGGPAPGLSAAGLGGLLAAGLAAATSLWLARPPAPLPAGAAPERFAAGRALADVEALAASPRPVGSTGHRRARELLVERMAELGLAVEVQQAVGVRRADGAIRAARVTNLIGRRPGAGEGGALLLVAHYDSRPNSPGAGDDAAGVAVALEVARAAAAGGPPSRELIVLLTDAEELGLLGARAFADGHPALAEVETVLNFEGRGSGGPVSMFETGAGDLELVRAFAALAPHPLASSLSAEVYSRMPNDTDFTVFRGAGKSGLNFAFLGGLAAYHSALDTALRLAPGSLQQMGDNALALARAPAVAGGGRGREGLYFNPVGHHLLVLSDRGALPLALGAAVAALALAVAGLRRGLLCRRSLGSAGLLALAVPVAGALAAVLLWQLVAGHAGWLLDTPHRLPHRLAMTGIALVLVGLAAAAGLAGLVRRLRPAEVGLGVVWVWAALAVVAAGLVPGASYLLLAPLAGLLAAAAVVVATRPRPAIECLLLSAGALPGVVLLAPLAMLVFQALAPAAVATAPAMLAVGLLLPALVAAAGGRQRLALAALAAGLAALAAALAGTDAERPRTADLVRLEELDSGEAFYLSRDRRPAPWVRERLGAGAESWRPPAHLGLGEAAALRGAGSAATAAGPQVTRLEDLRDDGRRLTLRVASPAGAPLLRVVADSTVQIRAVELAGRRFERSVEEANAPLELELAGFPPAGVELTLELPGRWPVELHVSELFYGLAEVPPLPPGLVPATSWTSHARLVHRSFLR